MTLADYLAKNYLTPDSKPEKTSKKRKRKHAAATGLVIADDDVLGWDKKTRGDDDDDDGPMAVNTTGTSAGSTSAFRRAKSSTWQTVGVPAPSSSEQAAADAILASAAAARATNTDENNPENAPVIADNDSGEQTMESGAYAGLQSAAAVTAQLERRKQAEQARDAASLSTHNPAMTETIYRDASGRIINLAAARAETAARAAAEEAKKRAEVEDAKGDVQRAAAVKRREDLRDAKFMTVARHADDIEMNEELKQRRRWGDTMANHHEDDGHTTNGGGSKVSDKAKKKVYAGAAPPNRYGIRPGYRWDGVDRSTGFEKEWFAARNKVTLNRDLEYAWQMDE